MAVMVAQEQECAFHEHGNHMCATTDQSQREAKRSSPNPTRRSKGNIHRYTRTLRTGVDTGYGMDGLCRAIRLSFATPHSPSPPPSNAKRHTQSRSPHGHPSRLEIIVRVGCRDRRHMLEVEPHGDHLSFHPGWPAPPRFTDPAPSTTPNTVLLTVTPAEMSRFTMIDILRLTFNLFSKI